MADQDASTDDRTEDATAERREDFRDRGQIALSKEFTSVAILSSCVVAFTSGAPGFLKHLQRLFITHFEQIAVVRIDTNNIMSFLGDTWVDILKLCLPIFLVTMVAASVVTLAQTRLSWSWERVAPDFSRLEPFSGIVRMFSTQAWVEVLKSFAKLCAVATVAYLILRSEWIKVPELMAYPMRSTWVYWGGITKLLFWSVAGFLLIISGVDYFWNFVSLEKQMRMTKQEVKEDFKNREGDQRTKGKMRNMMRELGSKKIVAKTKTATVLITNPTHYSIALRYNPGDKVPILVAKGMDFIALRMREIARDEKIPIVENVPLARELYATVKEGQEIPDTLYKVVAEIIRYVFALKGKKIPTKRGVDGRR
ncbi:MAG: EscU/YscU/HrcU family type III secretion system export apparatus switch protein [Proteobacteria bacterium]|nr:EscU/YscU/HrcU family type III secretion system export apparatus switch protein [Pseudomonadota bacterium]